MSSKKALIIGAGFGGIAAALELAKYSALIDITLVSDRQHFEFTPSLYRVVVGRSPLEVCVPISDILVGKKIIFVRDSIVGVDITGKIATGSSEQKYRFDFLVLAVGSEASFYGIEGLREATYSFKSIGQAMRLKEHLHRQFLACEQERNRNPEEAVGEIRLTIAGGGPSGVELAGELAVFCARLAKAHGVDGGKVFIDLAEASGKILPTLKPSMARKIARRLGKLGVNIHTNRPITRADISQHTLIWTAGIEPNALFSRINGLVLDQKGRVVVDQHLQAAPGVFIVGDGASTQHAGLAQSAIGDGKAAGNNIVRLASNEPMKHYKQAKPYYFVPVGPRWSASDLRVVTLYGFAGYVLRRVADFHYFLTILPVGKAFRAFFRSKTLCESCDICSV